MNPQSVLHRVERKSLKQAVVDNIRSAIEKGELRAGDQITELGLARKLGVSQPTIREALIELEHQGFIQRLSARKTYITALSDSDIREIYQVRLKLETLVVETLAGAAGVNLDAAGVACSRLLEAATQGLHNEFLEADLNFHRSLWRAAGNRVAQGMLEQLVPRLFAFVVIRQVHDDRSTLQQTAQTHCELLQQIRDGNVEAARRTLQQSLGQARIHNPRTYAQEASQSTSSGNA